MTNLTLNQLNFENRRWEIKGDEDQSFLFKNLSTEEAIKSLPSIT